MNKSRKTYYYAVREGRKVGIFTKWSDAKNQIDKFNGACYKKFEKRKDAEKWLAEKHVGKHASPVITYKVSESELEEILKHAYRNK